VALALEKHHLSLDDIEVAFAIETTFEPCYVCKIEILLRQKQYNAEVKVVRPVYIDEFGQKQVVKNSIDFKLLN